MAMKVCIVVLWGMFPCNIVGTLSPHMGSQPRGYVSLHKAGETKVVLSLNTEYHLGKG
jgi:hypothetical protein